MQKQVKNYFDEIVKSIRCKKDGLKDARRVFKEVPEKLRRELLAELNKENICEGDLA